jgi:hypothetical protein
VGAGLRSVKRHIPLRDWNPPSPHSTFTKCTMFTSAVPSFFSARIASAGIALQLGFSEMRDTMSFG